MMDPKVVRYVIFDLGGVVLEWNPDTIVREITGDPEAQRLFKREVFLHPEWTELDRGSMTEAEAIARSAGRTHRTIEEITAAMRIADRSMQPRPGTYDLMQDLAARGFPLYCLSNLPVERYAYLRRTYDFWDIFSGIVISAHIKIVKPHPGIYRHLLTTYNLEASACLFFDDMPHNVEGARAVGMQSLVFTDAATCREQLAALLKAEGRPA